MISKDLNFDKSLLSFGGGKKLIVPKNEILENFKWVYLENYRVVLKSDISQNFEGIVREIERWVEILS